eukprot:3502628-Rhodomonas_salina.1
MPLRLVSSLISAHPQFSGEIKTAGVCWRERCCLSAKVEDASGAAFVALEQLRPRNRRGVLDPAAHRIGARDVVNPPSNATQRVAHSRSNRRASWSVRGFQKLDVVESLAEHQKSWRATRAVGAPARQLSPGVRRGDATPRPETSRA